MPVAIFFNFEREKTEEEIKAEAEEMAKKAAESTEETEKADETKAESAEKEEEKEEKEEKPLPINDTTPLWLKNPKDLTDDDYKEFYHKVFNDMSDPLFWIHLNMDYPFNLKGILYFPKLLSDVDVLEGEIKLYSNQVYIADNIKEIVPEFPIRIY